jgi:hypothetical protein
MPMDPQVVDGKIQRGTPLWRLSVELGGEAELLHVHAGDLRDTAKFIGGKAKPVTDALALTDGKEPGEKVRVKAEELKALVDLAVTGKPAEPAKPLTK